MNNLLDKYYKEFEGMPSNAPIVRNNIKNDAFELVVFDILFSKRLNISVSKENISEISKYIIAPPDNGIDIFVEKGTDDEPVFDVIQVKNKKLEEKEVKDAFNEMRRTIEDFCKNPLNVKSESCREVLSNSNLEKSNKKACNYFVIHMGDLNDINGLRNDETILTEIDLRVIKESINSKVPEDFISVDSDSNILTYNASNPNMNAMACSISGYELAVLNNKYYSTEIGRNILFGKNLRESIAIKRSKSYAGMAETIDNNPELFWYYNNGVTIIAENFEKAANDKKIKLTNFSIVNGAQTTSALGQYLKIARRNRDEDAEDRLKSVHVLARVLKVPDEDTENNIAIYNNTQNPITSRDMVANRLEQKKLNEFLLDDNYPQIYMEIRNGSTVPSDFNKKYVHRKTTNEELAQIAYASFLQEPFTAKDKKASLFSNDYSQSKYTLNSIYHTIFNYDSSSKTECGVLFRKTKIEIDEALFTKQLYVECKKYLKGVYQQRLDKELTNLENETDDSKKRAIQNRVDTYAGRLETVGICMFYFIDLYYEFLDQFGTEYVGKRYDFDKFYSDKEYKNELTKECATLFLEKVINLLIDTAKTKGKASNLNNWVRSQTCQTEFQSKLQNDIAANLSWQDEYTEFMDKYKKIDI